MPQFIAEFTDSEDQPITSDITVIRACSNAEILYVGPVDIEDGVYNIAVEAVDILEDMDMAAGRICTSVDGEIVDIRFGYKVV